MAVSFSFGEWQQAIAIAVVLLINAAIGYGTERRAVRSIEALRALGGRSARVRRDGRSAVVDADALVPGDVVLLEAGDVVPAGPAVCVGSAAHWLLAPNRGSQSPHSSQHHTLAFYFADETVGGLTERWNNQGCLWRHGHHRKEQSEDSPWGLVRAATHDDSPHAGTPGRRSGDRRTAAATGAERRRKAGLVSLPAVPVADILRRPIQDDDLMSSGSSPAS